MPELFFIEEKKHIILFYDFTFHNILEREILSDCKIPMFTGVGHFHGRTFLFGGKEPETKLITNKAYEIVQKADKFRMIKRNRMVKNRSRTAIANLE